MTLDGAIKHYMETAEKAEVDASYINLFGEAPDELGRTLASCIRCANEHRQLANWLKLLKRILNSGDCNSCAMLHSQCRYAPGIGEQVRYNCPFYSQESEESE